MPIRAGHFVVWQDMRFLADRRDPGKSSTWVLPWVSSGTSGGPSSEERESQQRSEMHSVALGSLRESWDTWGRRVHRRGGASPLR
jgi:hypothetical protein